jgi:anti-anti-sigma regulatory factor
MRPALIQSNFVECNRFEWFLIKFNNKAFCRSADISLMTSYPLNNALSRNHSGSADPFTIIWPVDECTDRTASAFARLSKYALGSGARLVILNMSGCRFLSVGGLRNILQWHDELHGQGIMVRIAGLSPLLATVFALAKLDWILAVDRDAPVPLP